MRVAFCAECENGESVEIRVAEGNSSEYSRRSMICLALDRRGMVMWFSVVSDGHAWVGHRGCCRQEKRVRRRDRKSGE